MIIQKKRYVKNDVWLCEWCDNLTPLRILEIRGEYVRLKHGWMDAEEFNRRAKQRLGKARLFLGIKIGIEKSN